MKRVKPRLLTQVCVVGNDGQLAPWHKELMASAALTETAARPHRPASYQPNGGIQRGGVAANNTLAAAVMIM